MKTSNSPLMKQYNRLKQKYSNCILFFRVNDYYELFNDDAEQCARILNIPLTKTKQQVSLSGFTFDKLDLYLPIVVKAGYRVAIVDPLYKEPDKRN